MNDTFAARRDILRAAAALAATTVAGCAAQPEGPGQSPADDAGASLRPLPRRGEFIVRGATVLSMDPAIGDLDRGDVHVRDGAIVAVGRGLNAPAAATIDGTGMICLPGFVDTHMHLWTSLARPLIRVDDPARSYFPVTNRLGPFYTAEDSYRGVRLGVAECISAGVTTVHNWAHNIVSSDHADAELRAMRDLGIRGRLAYGPAQGMPNDRPMDLAGLARIQKAWMPNDGLLTLGICSRNIGNDPNPLRGNMPLEIARADWGGARALGLPITLHTSGPSPVMMLEKAGLLGPDVQLVHPLLTTPEERRILAQRGVSYSTAPVGEAGRPAAAGVIQLGELLEAGMKVSLSTDHTTTFAVDTFGAMRFLHTLHSNRIGARIPVTSRRLVQLATLDGAIDLGIADRTGSLTPGKRADLILVRAGDINMAPIGDPYEALVFLGQPRNVELTMVDGRVLWRSGRFTALDHSRIVREAQASVAALVQRAKGS